MTGTSHPSTWAAPLWLLLCSFSPILGPENPLAPLGPIGYWKGDDPATVPPAAPVTPGAPSATVPAVAPPSPPAPCPAQAADASGNGRAGTYGPGAGVSTLVPPTKFANPSSFTFDGVSGMVSVPDAPGLRVTSDFTVAFWKRKTAPSPDWVRLVGKGDGVQRTFGLWEFPGGENRLKFQIYNNTGGSVLDLDSNVAVPLNTWAHVTAVLSVNAAALYVDGKLVGNGMRTGDSASGAHPLTFGHAGYHGFFTGQLDDIRLYNRALSMSEIVYLAEGNGPPAEPKTLAVTSAAPRRVLLAWTASPTPAPAGTSTMYVVKRSPTPGSGYVPLAPAMPMISFTDGEAEPGATYSYVVTSVNTGGESAPSNAITVTVPAP